MEIRGFAWISRITGYSAHRPCLPRDDRHDEYGDGDGGVRLRFDTFIAFSCYVLQIAK